MHAVSKRYGALKRSINLVVLLAMLVGTSSFCGEDDSHKNSPGDAILFNGVWPKTSSAGSRENNKSGQANEAVQRRSLGLLRRTLNLPQMIHVPRDIPLHVDDEDELTFSKHRY